MNKPNDFLAANLNAPENFTLSDFYMYGLTPENTGLKNKDAYKDIKQVRETFKKDNGEFDEVAFDAFYDSVSRTYNDWALTDFAKNIMSSIPRSREDISDINNTNIRNTDTELFSLNDPWRHQRGMGNVYTLGKESFDIREVAQANNVRDAEGNKLDYTANDTGLFKNPFKSLFGTPLVLAEDENGQPILDEDGNPFYRELQKGESTYGKELLHISDTLTRDDSWINKFDFFDNDGLDKSVVGTIMNTVARVAPYLIPHVGPILGAIDAAKGLATAFPVLAKDINGFITNSNDNTSFGKAMNSMEAYMGRYGQSKSRYAMEHNWAFENVGDMIATSAAQLFQQRTFAYIPWLLKMQDSEKATKIGQALSISFMAATSAQDSLEEFKNAGMSDRAAGIANLAYGVVLWRLMNKDYFKDFLFKNSWLNSSPEMRNILRQNNKEAARIAINSIKNAAKPGATKILTQEEIKRESVGWFKQITDALTEAWKTKSWSPFKGLDIVAPGSAFAEGNVYLNRALNEGVEELMEEQLLDVLKVTSLGLESLGFNITDETKEKLDFGLTVNDALQRYLTSFVGGAIGGAVFEGLDKYNSRVLNKRTSDYAGRGLNGQLIRAIRNYGADRVLGELNTLWNAGKLGDKNLSSKGRFVADPENQGKEKFIFDEGTDTDNQNNMMRNIMSIRINTINSIMNNLGIYGKDNELLNGIVSEIEEEANKAGISTEEYMRKNKRDVFSEFVQKTGFADIILNDIGNLEIDAVDYETKIEDEKARIRAKYTDSDKAKAEEEINHSKIIKEWSKKRDDALKLREDILSGKAAPQYIKYADFAAHGEYVSKLLGKDEDKSVLDAAAYTWSKYNITYDSLSDELKKVMDEDYVNYQKLNGIDALYSANTLFQNVSNSIKPIIESYEKQYKDYVPANGLSESVIGDSQTNPDLIDPRIILNRTYRKDYHSIVDELLDPNKVTPKSIDVLLRSIDNYYKFINDNKVIAEYGDDWVDYALSRLSETLTEGFNVDILDKEFKKSLESKQFIENEQVTEDDPRFDEAFNWNSQYGMVEPLYDSADKRGFYIDRLKSIIPNITTNPSVALDALDEIKYNLAGLITQDEVRENTIKTLTARLEAIANQILKINAERAKYVHSPVIELAQLISFDLNGTEIPILDTIAKEKAWLVSKGTTSEYMLSDNTSKAQLEAAKQIIPIVEVALTAALTSNSFVNNFLEDSEKLPEINPELASLYINDFHFLQNKIDYLLYLNDVNKNAKVREHINVRKYFYRNVINRLINKKLIDGEQNPVIDKLSKSMKNIDFDDLWSKAGGVNLDLESDDTEVQANVIKAFAEFEHLIREHIIQNVTNYNELGKDIALCFDDTYKMKNGILSSNSNDDIDNFDLMTYLLTVAGTDSYDFGRKIKPVFEGDGKFPFFGQELAIRFAYLGMHNADLVNGAIEGISESTNEAIENRIIKDVDATGKTLDSIAEDSKEYLDNKAKLWNTVIIDGFAGVGKSTIITKIALDISNDIEAIAVSKDKSRANALGSQFNADNNHILTLDQLLSSVLGKEYITSKWIAPFKSHSAKLKSSDENEYKPIETNATYKNLRKNDSKRLVIVIDECTQLSEGEWQILADAAKAEGVTIIGLGNTMQIGAVAKPDGKDLTSVNLDDCVSLSTSKLTISMRTANAGKNKNNIEVGTLAKIAVDLQKDNPTHSISVLSKNPSLNHEVKLEYANDNGKVSGDMIVSSIDDAMIDRAVNNLGEKETLVVVTPNDSDFAASKAKYEDQTTSDGKPKVVFTKEDLIGGSEYDYAIINVDFDNENKVKLLDIKRFYTLMTRARKGSIIKDSEGLKQNLKVTSEPSVTASAQVVFEPNSDVAKQYKSTWLNAWANVSAPEVEAEEVENSPVESGESGGSGGSEYIDDVDLGTDAEGKEKVTVEEIVNEVDEKTNQESTVEQTDAPDDLTDEWITANAVRGYKAKQYARRKRLLSQRATKLVDADKFADWLAENDVVTLNSPINTSNTTAMTTYKDHIKILSSIFLTASSVADRFQAFSDRLYTKLSESNIYTNDFASKLRDSFANNDGVFFLQKIKDNDMDMMVYYCFGDKYTIPISIITIEQSSVNVEGFYKNIIFNQETGIIPISSNGRKRSKISDTIGNFASIVKVGDVPITAVFTPDENAEKYIVNDRRNKYFINNKGKSFIGLSSIHGLTNEEARSQWTPQTDQDKHIKYFLQESDGSFAIAGVQEDINADTFFDTLENVKTLLNSNVQSEATDKIVQKISEFFNVSVDDVKNDFAQISKNNPDESAIENAKRFAKIRAKYNILYRREIELMTSAILQYCADKDKQMLNYLTENLYTELIQTYTRSSDGTVVRTPGFRITVYDNKYNPRRFEIIPNSNNLQSFNIYEVTSQGVRLTNEPVLGEVKSDDFIENNRINHRKLINAAWKIIFDKSDIRHKTGISAELKTTSDLNDNTIDDLIRSGKFTFSLTTESLSESNSIVKYFSPFESTLLKLVSYPPHIGKTGRFLNDSDFMNVLKNSSIFTYGIYRQIIAKDSIGADEVWRTGNVDSEKLTWDIVKVLAPVYSTNFIEITEDNDQIHSAGEYFNIYHQLITNETDDLSNVTATLNGNQLLFSSGLRVDVNDERWKNTFGEEVANAYAAKNYVLKSISINNRGISVNFKSNSGNHSVQIASDKLDVLLKDIKHPEINLLTIANNSVIADIKGVKFIGDAFPTKINKDGITETIRRTELNNVNGSYTLYVYSDKLGLTKLELESVPSELNTFIDKLISKSNQYGNYIGITEDGWPLYHKTGVVITAISDVGETPYFIKAITNTGLVLMDENGLTTEIPLASIVDGTSLPNMNLLQVLNGTPKLFKSNGTLQVVGGKFKIAQGLVTSISNYDKNEDIIELNGIDISTNKITLNLVTYDLNPNISENMLDVWFDKFYLTGNLKLATKNKIKEAFKNISSKLPEFDMFINSLTGDNLENNINDYLKANILRLNGIYKVSISSNQNVYLSEDVSANAAIKLAILKQNGGITINDIPETIVDSKNILKSPEFSVTLLNSTIINGIVERVNKDWKVSFTADNQMSLDYLFDKLEQLKQNPEVSNSDIEYFEYRLNQLKNKTSDNPAYATYRLQLIMRAKSDPDSVVSRFFRELTNYNENCKF